MKWFKEHKLFSITSGIVLGLCLIIIISYATSGGSTIIGKGVQTVAAVIEKPISYISGGIEKTFSGVFNYRKTQKENEALKEELIAVKEENLKLQMTQEELEELKKLSEVFSYEPFTTDRQAIAGEVIALDMSNPYVVFTIGVGSEKGIKKDNIVANEKGLVGKVYECGPGWSKVVSVLSDGNNISFKTLRDPAITGVVAGNGKDKLEGYLMNENARIIKGDTLITSGIGIYPAGISIGKVTSVDFDDNKQLKVITVEPTVHFDSMQKVAVFI